MAQTYTPYWPAREKLAKYSANRINGMNMHDSAIAAGYSETVANVAGQKIETRHLKSIKEALAESGVTTNRLAKVINDGLDAKRIDDSIDYRERREYTKLSLEALGELKSGTTVAVQINLPAVAVNKDAWGEE